MKRLFLFLILLLMMLHLSAKKKIKVACVGNSVTYGYGLQDREHDAYPVRLQQMLGTDYEVGNFGKSGSTLLRHGHRPYNAQQEYRDAMAFKGDLVIIHLGLNDTDPRNWPDYNSEFNRNYTMLIDSLRSVNPKAKVWLCLMTPIFDRHRRFLSGTRDWHSQIQKHIRQIAKASNCGLIDLYTPLCNRPDIFADALHPNAEGAEILARTVYGAITGNYGFSMPDIYGDGMVMQRREPVMFRGMANVGEEVKISFNGQTLSAKAAADGQWKVIFPAMKAGGPYTAEIHTPTAQKTVKDIYIGEVWLCSGQSNMELMVSQVYSAKDDVAHAANQRYVHLYNMPARYSTNQVKWSANALDSVNRLQYLQQGPWTTCNAETVSRFSAIGYHFGRMLADSLQVPIGIICNAVGGTTTESWIDRQTLEWDYPQILTGWYHGDFGQPWARQRALYNISNTNNPLQRHPYEPAYMFEAGMLPLKDYAIKGVLWYQGESNAHNIEVHEDLFRLLEKSWRRFFGNRRLPFYFVQLSSLNRLSWPQFRDSQRRLAQKPYTWMTVTSDLGDSLDVHYRNKKPVGERLALQALHHSYGYNVVSEGPGILKVEAQGNIMVLNFDNAEGLRANGPRLIGFEVAGEDGLYYGADARVDGKEVIVMSERVVRPVSVRYGWQPFTRANLVNGAGLPCSTFEKTARFAEPINATFEELRGFPSTEKGISKGVSACLAGVIDHHIIMAGGCNFPEMPVTKGGKKRYYQGVYAAPLNGGKKLMWKKIGELPEPSAYGVSINDKNSIICIGGMNAEGSLKRVIRLQIADGKAVITSLPDLPQPMDNMTGCLVRQEVYVAGGDVVYALNLDDVNRGWRKVINLPKVRQQPVSGNRMGTFALWGGFSPKTAQQPASLAMDGLAIYRTAIELPAPRDEEGEQVFLGGAAAANVGKDIVVVGGVNKEVFIKALNAPEADYMTHEPAWYRFNPYIFVHHHGEWKTAGKTNLTARAGATLAVDGSTVYVIGGEQKPGIRLPNVVKIELSGMAQ